MTQLEPTIRWFHTTTVRRFIVARKETHAQAARGFPFPLSISLEGVERYATLSSVLVLHPVSFYRNNTVITAAAWPRNSLKPPSSPGARESRRLFSHLLKTEKEEKMGKISRSVLAKGGRRGPSGLKGKVHRSVSRVPAKKSIVRDRAQDYHGVDKLEVGEKARRLRHTNVSCFFFFFPAYNESTRDIYDIPMKKPKEILVRSPLGRRGCLPSHPVRN